MSVYEGHVTSVGLSKKVLIMFVYLAKYASVDGCLYDWCKCMMGYECFREERVPIYVNGECLTER